MSIALIDCNSFYASCEKCFRPDLRNSPVVVLSNNDGCIVAMSKEAKKLDIPRGTPLFKLQNLFRSRGVKIFSSNYALYGDLSKRVMDIISLSSDSVEIYSIDEAFANWDFTDPLEEARELRKRVYKWVGIPVSIGIAETKTLAKVANHIGKKSRDGLFVITPETRESILKNTPVEDIWGIGRQKALFLRNRGVFTAWEFTQKEEWWIKKHLTIVGLRTYWELKGRPSITMEEEVKDNQAILSSKSFGNPITELIDLLEATKEYVNDALNKMIRQDLKAREITIFLMTNRFRKNDKQYRNSITIEFPSYTSYLPDFIKATDKGLRQIYRSGYRYKKTGVLLTDLKNSKDIIPDLFQIEDPRKKRIEESVKEINMKYGKGVINCNPVRKTDLKWKMRRELLSPSYTTKWGDIPKV